MNEFIKEEVSFLRDLGSRTTGSKAHKTLIQRVYQQFRDLGYNDIKKDSFTFDR